jgi:hypothetical protein
LKALDTIQTALEAYVQECPSEAKSIDRAWAKVTLALRCALADLEGVMPEFEPTGDRQHPGWKTIKDLKKIGLKP